MPPDPHSGPEEMWMLVADRFDIPGSGLVLTGQLEGAGVLRAGDIAGAGAGEAEIIRIEAFRAGLAHAEAGANVGLNLGPWAPQELGVGARLVFRRRPDEGVPALGPDGAVVPAQWRVLVGYSSKSRAMAFTFGVLALDGLRVRLVPKEGDPLVDAPSCDISTGPLRATKVLIEAGGARFEIVGPQLQWLRRDAVAPLVQAWRPAVIPPPLPVGPPPWWARLLFMPAGRLMRQQILWRPILLAMLEARGADRL